VFGELPSRLPWFPKGDFLVTLPINDEGKVNLDVLIRFLEECPNRPLKEDTKQLRECVKRLGRVWFDLEACMQVALLSVRTQSLAYQICEHYCLPFDKWVYTQLFPETIPSTPPKKTKKMRLAEALDGVDTRSISAHAKWDYGARKRLLTKYDATRKKRFGGGTRHFNFVVDAARRGAVNRMYGMMTDDKNVSAWMNPTVLA